MTDREILLRVRSRLQAILGTVELHLSLGGPLTPEAEVARQALAEADLSPVCRAWGKTPGGQGLWCDQPTEHLDRHGGQDGAGNRWSWLQGGTPLPVLPW